MGGMNLLRCICDDTRFSILESLGSHGELPVGELSRRLERDQPLVSHHLRVLRECGIVTCRTDGRRSMYSIANAQITALISDIVSVGDRINALCVSCCAPETSGGGTACCAPDAPNSNSRQKD